MVTLSKGNDIVSLILKDHRPLKKLIKVLKKPEIKKSQKKDSLEEFVFRLTSHAKAEEKSLYIEMREYKDLRGKSFEGDTGHKIAENLVHEINSSPDDDCWNAKVKVLAELVEHHIQEEEKKVLPAAQAKISGQIRQNAGVLYLKIKNEFDDLKNHKLKN